MLLTIYLNVRVTINENWCLHRASHGKFICEVDKFVNIEVLHHLRTYNFYFYCVNADVNKT